MNLPISPYSAELVDQVLAVVATPPTVVRVDLAPRAVPSKRRRPEHGDREQNR